MVLLSFILFLTLASNVTPALAADYNFFRDLFSDEVPIENGSSSVHTKAGIYKEGVLASSPVAADNGVKNFKAGPWLVMSPPKNKNRDGEVADLFWHIVLNTGGTRRGNFTDAAPDTRSFVVRLGYKKADGTQVYALNTIPDRYTPSFTDHKIKEEIMKGRELLQFIMYVDPSDTDVSGWWAGVGGVLGVAGCAIATGGVGLVGGTACAAGGGAIGHGLGGFFTSVQSWILITHQQARTDISFSEPVPYNTPMTADFWYCAGYSTNTPIGTHDDARRAPKSLGDYVEYFTKGGTWKDDDGIHTGGYKYDVDVGSGKRPPCYGELTTSYNDQMVTAAFKIGQTLEFTSPTSIEEAAEQDSQELSGGIAQTKDQKANGFLPACDLFNGYRPIVDNVKGTFMGCIAQLTYYAIWKPIAWVAGITGELFDFFLGYSLADDSYRAAFAVSGWKLVRDISNIFFIIILIWTGLANVFNLGGISMKKVVPALIINALLINFSLFGTQVIIDISNITSRIFYNSTQVCTGKCSDTNNDGTPDNQVKSSVGQYKSLSVAITSGFNPQRLFSTGVLDSSKAVPIDGKEKVTNGSEGASDIEIAGYFIVVCLIAAAIMLGVAKMFWGTAFMFLGRVIGLYIVMIFSPFAVMTRGKMPLVGNIEGLSWSSWSKDLTSYALLAPIFVFFLYIISAFIQSGFMDTAMGTLGDSFFENVLHVAIPMLIVYFMIGKGVGIAKKYAGEMGMAVQNWTNNTAGKVVGFGAGAAIGVATGGAALVGRGAMSALGKTKLSTWAATNKDSGGMKGFLAGSTNRFMQWGQKTSFDARNTKVGGIVTGGISTGLSKFGIKMKDNVSGNIKLGQKDYIGGNNKIRADRLANRVKKIEEKNDMSHLSDSQATKVWKNRTEKIVGKAGEKAWEEGTLAALVAANGKEAELKALKDVGKELADGLKAANESGNKEQVKSINQKIDDNTKAQTAITAPLVAQVIKQKNALGKDIEKTELYEKGVEARREELKDRYGKVENAKDLSAAMRNEYALRMIEDSIALSKGKKRRWQPVGGGLTGGLGIFGGGIGAGAILAGLGAGALGGGLLANYIDSLQESELAAAKKVISNFDKYKKQNSKQSRVKELNEELTKIEDLIDEHVAHVLDVKVEELKNLKLKDHERDEHFNTAKGRAQLAVDLSKDAYDKAIKKFKKIAEATKEDKEELNAATDEYYKKVDTYNKVKDALKNRRIYMDSLEREQDRIATDEERAKNAAEKDKAKKTDDSKT